MKQFTSTYKPKIMHRIYITSAIILLIFSNQLIGQSHTYEHRNEYKDMEIKSQGLQSEIVNSSIYEDAKIDSLIQEWYDLVGAIEPVERLKIITDIANGKYRNEDYKFYYKHYIPKFINRCYDADKEDFDKYYSLQKQYYNYVPLNSEYDNWTHKVASELLKNYTADDDISLILHLLSEDIGRFEKELKHKNSNTSYLFDTYQNGNWYITSSFGGYFKLYAGFWSPLSTLKKTASPSFTFGFAYGIPTSIKNRMEVKMQIAFLSDNEEIDFRFDDVNYSTSNIDIMTIGLRNTREYMIRKNTYFDFNAELNLGIINTDINDDEEDSHYGIATIDLATGFGTRFKYSGNEFGIESMVHFAPYNLNSSLRSDLGMFYLSSNIYFIF